MQKQAVTFQIKTISSVVLSPRNSAALYRGIDDETVKMPGEFGILYPFYQYGEYEEYLGDQAKYYIPGSSLKGALHLSDSEEPSRLMMDDLPVDARDIAPRHLWKAQYLDTEKGNKDKQATLDIFFPNVAVEMLANGVTLTGKLFWGETKEELITAIHHANDNVKVKIDQMLELVAKIQKALAEDKAKNKAFPEQLREIEENLRGIREQQSILLLGGFKGLRHSILFRKEKESDTEFSDGALYIDDRTMLPNGFVQIMLP